jgi:hypothetical protein
MKSQAIAASCVSSTPSGLALCNSVRIRRKWAERAPTGGASGRAGVRAKAAIPLRSRNQASPPEVGLHRSPSKLSQRAASGLALEGPASKASAANGLRGHEAAAGARVPFLAHRIASSRRSSPQKTSPLTRNDGEPKTLSRRASSVASCTLGSPHRFQTPRGPVPGFERCA